jgi:hypothetical protein
MTAMTTPAHHPKPAGRSIFEAWGRIIYRRRRLVLVIALLFAAFAAVWGTSVPRLKFGT